MPTGHNNNANLSGFDRISAFFCPQNRNHCYRLHIAFGDVTSEKVPSRLTLLANLYPDFLQFHFPWFLPVQFKHLETFWLRLKTGVALSMTALKVAIFFTHLQILAKPFLFSEQGDHMGLQVDETGARKPLDTVSSKLFIVKHCIFIIEYQTFNS